jgi:hypothetical protein
MVSFDKICQEIMCKINVGLFSLEMFRAAGPSVDVHTCNRGAVQQWTWNSVDGTIQNKYNGQCLGQVPELEVWTGPLDDGSAAVVLLNRGNSISEPITVQWSDIEFPPHDSALVRDLWARKALGPYRNNFTSPNIDPHSVMMLKITLFQ